LLERGLLLRRSLASHTIGHLYRPVGLGARFAAPAGSGFLGILMRIDGSRGGRAKLFFLCSFRYVHSLFNMMERTPIDWPAVIEHNRIALLEAVASLFAMLGLLSGEVLGRIPRFLHRRVLRDLRPAEAAVRRLIVAAAQGIVVKLPPHRPMSKDKKIVRKDKSTGKAKRPSFRLDDPQIPMEAPRRHRRYSKFGPGIHVWPYDTLRDKIAAREAAAAAASANPNDGLIDGTRLAQRLEALKGALEHIPEQAIRLARWIARRKRALKTRLVYTNPLRYGPPRFRKAEPDSRAEVLLHECHLLAREATKTDTS
jgi:hypothetical protein